MKKILLSVSFLFLFFHLMYSTVGPNEWSLSLSGVGPIWAIVVNPQNQSVLYAASNTTGVHKSTNAGLTWNATNTGLTNLTIQTIAISNTDPNVLMVGTTNGGSSPGVYKSTDAGANWFRIVNGISDTTNIQQVLIHPTNSNIAWISVFTGTGNSTVGLFKTTDGGNNWFASNNGIGTIKNILSLAVNPLNPNVLYCGTSFQTGTSTGPSKIYRSNDGGSNWTDASTGLPSATTEINPVRVLSVSTADTAIVLAGLFMNTTNGGAYLSTNGGQSWTKKHTGLPITTGTLIRGGIIKPGSVSEFFVGLDGSTPRAVFRTTDAGNSWTNFVGGPLLNTYSIRGLAFRTAADSTLYASGAFTSASGQGVFEYTWIPSGVHIQNGIIPSAFSLYQNYPNPFNPSTRIDYDVPFNAFVNLSVYDLTGRIVSVLVNKQKSIGSHSVWFDAGNLSSGIYLYKLETENYSLSRKMLLVK